MILHILWNHSTVMVMVSMINLREDVFQCCLYDYQSNWLYSFLVFMFENFVPCILSLQNHHIAFLKRWAIWIWYLTQNMDVFACVASSHIILISWRICFKTYLASIFCTKDKSRRDRAILPSHGFSILSSFFFVSPYQDKYWWLQFWWLIDKDSCIRKKR